MGSRKGDRVTFNHLTHSEDVAALAPAWIGEVRVYHEYRPTRGDMEYTVYTNINSSQWCVVRANSIDQHCGMRFDFTLPIPEVEELGNSHVAETIFGDIQKDYADLILTVTTRETQGDSLLHYGDGARFLPRDTVRDLMHTMPDYFYPRIAENSSFRNEDWYKEWEATKETE